MYLLSSDNSCLRRVAVVLVRYYVDYINNPYFAFLALPEANEAEKYLRAEPSREVSAVERMTN